MLNHTRRWIEQHSKYISDFYTSPPWNDSLPITFVLFTFLLFLFSLWRMTVVSKTYKDSVRHRDCSPSFANYSFKYTVHSSEYIYMSCMQETIITFGEDIQISVYLYSNCDDECIVLCRWHVNVEFVLTT